MKHRVYILHLKDGSTVTVRADALSVTETRYLFHREGQLVGQILIDSVVRYTEESPDT